MNKRKLMSGAVSIALAVTMLSTTAFAASVSFNDVSSDHWAAPSIATMAEKGVITGVGNNLFAPDQQVTGDQFLTMVVRQFYGDKIKSTQPGDPWYVPYMTVAEAEGLTIGAQVGAESVINRYDMSRVMYNVLQKQGVSAVKLSDTSKVADWSSVPVVYQDAVSVCYNAGLLSGTDAAGTFAGSMSMTRAQAAVVMDRLIEVCTGSTSEAPSGSISIIKGETKQITDKDVTQDMVTDAYIPRALYSYDGQHFSTKYSDEDAGVFLNINTTGYAVLEVEELDRLEGGFRAYVDGQRIDTLDWSGINKVWYIDVAEYDHVTLGAVANTGQAGTAQFKIRLREADQLSGTFKLPAGATKIDESVPGFGFSGYAHKNADGSYELPSGGMGGGMAAINFRNQGWSKLVFTAKANTTDQRVMAGSTDSFMGVVFLDAHLASNTAETFTVDISRNTVINITGPYDATIYNIYAY